MLACENLKEDEAEKVSKLKNPKFDPDSDMVRSSTLRIYIPKVFKCIYISTRANVYMYIFVYNSRMHLDTTRAKRPISGAIRPEIYSSRSKL